ncbi:MAG TPA: MFS transporter, partial [Trueperaceae bacterium]|nr:MFS transporter [Trueperaceae bacterium]
MKPGPSRALTLRYAALAGLLELAIAVPMPVLVLHMTGRGLDLGLIGLAFTVRALLVVILELPTGGLADAIGRRPVALASQLFTLASFVLLLFVTGPFTALAYAVMQGIGSALHSGALDAWYVDELHKRDADVPLQPHLAMVDVAQASGMLIGSAVGGLLP